LLQHLLQHLLELAAKYRATEYPDTRLVPCPAS